MQRYLFKDPQVCSIRKIVLFQLHALFYSDIFVCYYSIGVIFCVFEAWGGTCRVSDRRIVTESSPFDLLEPGDIIIADKGFTLSNLLKKTTMYFKYFSI